MLSRFNAGAFFTLNIADAMIRKKIKSFIRKTAVRVLDMEFDVQDRPNPGGRGTGDFDPSVIPTIVDGDGDTPGPNHKRDIGRTWLAAQMAAGVSPFIIDTRPPNETVAGVLPSAHIMSGTSVLRMLDQLPEDKSLRVTLYDQTGEQDAESLAEQLRDAGWSMARRLKGGYAEWLEYDEPIETPTKIDSPLQIGDSVDANGHSGIVMQISSTHVILWQPPDQISAPIPTEQIHNS